ncbi:MAG: endoribonuclease [Betaproteobacteria bacterium]|nr:endoribonuclease [Betaproteobacteria bacterium]
MPGKIDQRLAELKITLPEAGNPVFNYVPFVTVGNLVFMSGQLPRADGKLAYAGKLGRDLSVEQGKAAARICAINLLSQLKVACGGDLDRVVRCVRLTGFVNSDPEFAEQPQVINGASDFMTEVFGDKGKHARTAISAGGLPAKAAVEVEAVFEISV